MDGPDLQEIPTGMAVVAAALVAPDGRILVQRRRPGGSHGGLWEFPGGKIEYGETKVFALIREIAEELDVELDANALEFVASVGDAAGGLVIDLYSTRLWRGEPRCLDAAELAWCSLDELAELAMPPLDVPLARALAARLQGAK